ncbi:MAG: hypothetical protein CSA39_07195 [Flavobacteriales bacterium]|nr:MAG: hypothetical protein CSA39_07195 [Flavobacteriales bacterium]
MKKFLIGVICTLIAVFIIYKYTESKVSNATLKENTALIEQQIKQVGKLIVTEGHFSQVYNYRNSKSVFGNLIAANKRALVVVNAYVTVNYDLSEIIYDIDQENKILTVKYIPKEDIKISPELEYYDIQADYLNPFGASDYNKIKDDVNRELLQKLKQSPLQKNAKTRLLEELSKLYILTNSMGWTLHYNERKINAVEELETMKP